MSHLLSSWVILLLVALLIIASLTCSRTCQVSESAHSVSASLGRAVELPKAAAALCCAACCFLVSFHTLVCTHNQLWILHVCLMACHHGWVDTALQHCCPLSCCMLPSRSYPGTNITGQLSQHLGSSGSLVKLLQCHMLLPQCAADHTILLSIV